MFAPLQRLQGLKGFNPPKPTQLPQASFNLPELSATAPSSKSLNLNNNSASKTNESPQTESVSSAPSENSTNPSTNSSIANIPKFASILSEAKNNPVAKEINNYFSSKYGQDVADKMVSIAKMEGDWKPSAAVSNKGEQSFGTFQINLNAHNDKVAKYTGTPDKDTNAKWLSNVDNTIKIADEIYKESGFSPWTTAKKSVKTYQGVLGNGIADFDSLKPSNNSTNSNFKSFDLSGIKVKDEVEWGAKFAEPPEGLLDKIVSPTGSNQVNSPTVYRDVPAGTSGFNISKATGKQINFGADFAAEKGKPLINPFTGDAKVVKPLGLSGAGNAVRLEYTTEDGQKVYADLNHNDTNKVKVGQTVKAGEIVATAGASGNTQGVHSDFSLYSLDKNNKPIYFDTSGKKW